MPRNLAFLKDQRLQLPLASTKRRYGKPEIRQEIRYLRRLAQDMIEAGKEFQARGEKFKAEVDRLDAELAQGLVIGQRRR